MLVNFINDCDRPHAGRRGDGGAAGVSQDRRTTVRRRWKNSSPTTRTWSSAFSAVGAGRRYDAFKLLAEAQKYGARAALFGRKINNAENQLAFVEFLRLIADGELTAEEAVRAYHAVLGKLKLRPLRPLEQDQQITETALSYGGDAAPRAANAPKSTAVGDSAAPAFTKMTPAERLAYHQQRLNRMFGESN